MYLLYEGSSTPKIPATTEWSLQGIVPVHTPMVMVTGGLAGLIGSDQSALWLTHTDTTNLWTEDKEDGVMMIFFGHNCVNSTQ